MVRKSISPEIQAEVLHSSRRRCPICFSYHFDVSQKKGQIAHVDRDHRNNKRSNLVYLCLEHHDQYDSTTSQSKGITQKELLKCKAELNKYLTQSIPTAPILAPVDHERLQDFEKNIKNITQKKTVGNISPELYNMRIPIYNSYRSFVGKLIKEANFEIEDLFLFINKTHEAIFIYGDEIVNYLELVKEKAIRFRTIQRIMEARRDSLETDEWDKLVEEDSELLIWFSQALEEGKLLFRQYLQLGE